tara:strand:+ start:1594 stop:2535 length:942 start_codon:yes stop_codon:yes gene_type:complete
MKTVIVLGTGNSGAGAIRDYLSSREDFQSPFDGAEFRIVNDPDGIDDLYNSLYKNFSLNGCSNKILNFEKFIKNTYKSNYNKKHKIYNKKLIYLANIFVRKISLIKFNGSPQFYLDKISFLKKLNFYANRLLLNKDAKNINLLKIILPCEEKLFLNYAEEFIFSIYKNDKRFNKKKNIVIEQGGNFLSPISSTKYYGQNRKIIFVRRDPKAIFWSMKRRNSLSYPGHDIKKFVKWYKELSNKISKVSFKNVIQIKFEDFFQNFNKEKYKLSKKLEINPDCKDNFDIDHTMKNLFKFKKNLSYSEIKYIDDNLN